MRKAYEFLNRTPTLYCRLLSRIVQRNIVIDHEEVLGFGDKPFYGLRDKEREDQQGLFSGLKCKKTWAEDSSGKEKHFKSDCTI